MSTSHDEAGPADGRAGQRRTFVLIPGAGGTGWYWHCIVPLLRRAGHGSIAVDLPGDDPAAGLPEYADLVVAAAGRAGQLPARRLIIPRRCGTDSVTGWHQQRRSRHSSPSRATPSSPGSAATAAHT